MSRICRRDFVWPDDPAGRLEVIRAAAHHPDLSVWVLQALGACKRGVRRMRYHQAPRRVGHEIKSAKDIRRGDLGTIASYWNSEHITLMDVMWWLAHVAGMQGALAPIPLSNGEVDAICCTARVIYPGEHWRTVRKRSQLIERAKIEMIRSRYTYLGQR